MPETKKLQGKVAVLIGDTTGIELVTVKLFVKEGAFHYGPSLVTKTSNVDLQERKNNERFKSREE